jgi:LPXTG-site transpeptidase (sortase) family protein
MTSQRSSHSNRLSFILIGLGAVLMCAGMVALLAAFINVPVLSDLVEDSSSGYSSIETGAAFGEPLKTPTPGPSPTPENKFPPGTAADVGRLRIPRFEVDASLITMGVDEQGVMQSPSNAHDVAWYHFTAKPGFGSNAVFAAHVDYVNVGPAVFWHLKDLVQGDTIQVEMEDGTVYTYAVDSYTPYDAATAPVNDIVGPSAEERITLITCTGTFDSGSHQYDKRLVVTAVRIA